MRSTKLIIDTDPGVDDAFALALAARHPGIELVGVTTVFGNVGLEHTTRNALRLLTLCGRTDVPVAAGAARPLVHPEPPHAEHVHGTDGLSGQAHTLPEHPSGPETQDGVTLLAELLAAAEEPVTLAPIGPLTNIAALLAAHPWAKRKIERVVIMGGSTEGGNVSAAAEFNIACDPEAAARVFTEDGLRRVLVGLDVTMQTTIDAAWLDTLDSAVGGMLAGLTSQYFDAYDVALVQRAIPMHDALAVAEAIEPGIVTTTTLPVAVDTAFGPSRGATVADRRRGSTAAHRSEVAVAADAERLRALLHARLSG